MTILDLKDKLYTSTEVANILGVSLRSVYRYLDEGKLDADVKTATGRHRFSKQNILDFLYPDRSNEAPKTPAIVRKAPVVEETKEDIQEPVKAEKIVTKDTIEEVPVKSSIDFLDDVEEEVLEEENEEISEEATQDEPVDWLARFRAAAEKYRAEQATAPSEVQEDKEINNVSHVHENINENAEPEKTIDSFIPKYEEVITEQKGEYYYLSGIGGLKDIAQGLDKAAKKASLDYAFTMDAGLSLFKPIRPFSLIHSYIRPADRDYFEKTLKLTEVSRNSAQLCLVMSDDADVYNSKKEMYGLNVVSKDRLRIDLTNSGEKELVEELDNIA